MSQTISKPLEELRKRLLDLTSRNRLINFKVSQRDTLRVIDELPNQLVSLLLTEKSLKFIGVPEPSKDELIAHGYLLEDPVSQQIEKLKPSPSAEDWAKRLGFHTNYEVPDASEEAVVASNHNDDCIQTLLYSIELENTLKKLFQVSESAIQEMGANILYMAFGFLEWYESQESEAVRLAPLFLVPVKLTKGKLDQKSKTYQYSLSYTTEEIIVNLSLKEKLRCDFGLELPDLDETTEPEDYFREVKDLIKVHQPQWRVRRYISLALLNFSKLLMYLDLDSSRWPTEYNLIDHPIISAFLNGYQGNETSASSSLSFGEEYFIDEIEDIHNKYPIIDDADSSQHSALIDAMNGKNLVIQGPPGTGKSQTITNLIAAALSQGKSVLFVAEKLAALEVVKNRLDKVGLGEFCLELHSHKSQKKQVIDDLQERISNRGKYRHPSEIDLDITRYSDLKNKLKDHAARVNRTWKETGKTVHEILMAAARYRSEIGDVAPEQFYPINYNGDSYRQNTHKHHFDQVEQFSAVYKEVVASVELKDLKKHPWVGLENQFLEPFDVAKVIDYLKAWQSSLIDLKKEANDVGKTLGVSFKLSNNNLMVLASDIAHLPDVDGNEYYGMVPLLNEYQLKKTEDFLEIYEQANGSVALLRALPPEVNIDNLANNTELLLTKLRTDIPIFDIQTIAYQYEEVAGKFSSIESEVLKIIDVFLTVNREHLTLTVNGLKNIISILEILSGASLPLWRLNNDIFDNDELDDLLLYLNKEALLIQMLKADLSSFFDINRLPSYDDLDSLFYEINNAGFFKLFNSSWRRAKQQLKDMSTQQSIKFNVLVLELPRLMQLRASINKLNNDQKARRLLNEYFEGHESNFEQLLRVREFYKTVRRKFGYGFLAQAPIGDAILNLSYSSVKSIKSLIENGNILWSLRDIYSKLTVLAEDINILKTQKVLGNESQMLNLIADIKKTSEICLKMGLPLKSTTIQCFYSHVQEVKRVEDQIRLLKGFNLEETLFKGFMTLDYSNLDNNSSKIQSLKSTLMLANYLLDSSRNKVLVKIIENKLNYAFIVQIKQLGVQLNEKLKYHKDSYLAFSQYVKLEPTRWLFFGSAIDQIILRNEIALLNSDAFVGWLNYIKASSVLHKIGLEGLVRELLAGNITADMLSTAYNAGVYDLLAREVFLSDPSLANFSVATHEKIQQQFVAYDQKLKKLQSQKIAWVIDQKDIPQGIISTRSQANTELSLIKHECAKKTRHISIRELMRRAGNAVVALKPCLMMGPMSVAQYLAPGQLKFDLVIMDEASQIRPQDALGAIARGSQIVVVGDPNQLPPSNFFGRSLDGDEDEDTINLQQVESILDATLPIFNSRQLRWHYRSQHESLIAFSNYSFYNNKLIIFPSPNKTSINMGLQFNRIHKGTFVNRRNMEEAKIIAESVRDHLKHRSYESLGVVAMNLEQRLQIESAIESLAKNDVAFQGWLEEDSLKNEPLFIKNLENVQGDERDVIYVSMTYGPQEVSGKVPQRFGPINAEVGWRRLNVLLTRSKKRMSIFSSMGSSDIVIGSTSSKGVQSLKDFLAYCETGIIASTLINPNATPDSDFEINVMSLLKEAGFECIPQVGVAGFFIDIAVIDPGNKGRYLMGIECDGATYHSAKSARDRDRLRQTILERLGWNIKRIWSTDWFRNPHATIKPIIEQLKALKTEPIVSQEKSEADEIKEIIKDTETESLSYEQGNDLYITLLNFDRDVVCKEFPNIPEKYRLLRPSVIEALVEHMPTNRSEFLEAVPSYLRESISSEQGKYLDDIFFIINNRL